ncbi:hypothetical protein H6G83_30865 [Anabaena azotica FACHB-119]|uniref:Uncharacterized protein n=1 Tax=Anabaena azotica FACHB-119 TaxID=947527 RepID=A0ABR8DGS3_9NOST|nr:hypothetical protein [Anabaena azotica FACHB-119]
MKTTSDGDGGDGGESKIQNLESQIEEVVRRRIIENWEGQDEPEHLLRDCC